MSSRMPLGEHLGLAYGSIAVLLSQVLDSIESPEATPIDDPRMQAVHELREITSPEMSQWLSCVYLTLPDHDAPTEPAGRIAYARRIILAAARALTQWAEALRSGYSKVPAELFEVISTLTDDVERLDAVVLP